jgi:hypothetical protein
VNSNLHILPLHSSYFKTISSTLLLANNSATPIGMKIMPTANMAGMTVDAVKIGCHAGSFCCRKFEAFGRFFFCLALSASDVWAAPFDVDGGMPDAPVFAIVVCGYWLEFI